MSEQLENKLIQFVERVVDGMNDGIDFMSAELPVYVEQLLMWHMMHSILQCLVPVLLIPASIWYSKSIYIYLKNAISNGEGWCFFGSSKSVTSGLADMLQLSVFIVPGVSLFSLFCINVQWLQIIIAPKVWLVEYVAKLV